MLDSTDTEGATAENKDIEIEHIKNDPSETPTCMNKVTKFLFMWHLPIFFIVVLSAGYLFPIPGAFLQSANLGGVCIMENACVLSKVSDVSIFLIFIISGIKLETGEILSAMKECKVVILGTISILFLSPLIGFIVIQLSFSEPEYAIGLAIFYVQATSLSSGPTIAAQADGNVALALLLTVVTNILGVITMPIFVAAVLKKLENGSESQQVKLETVPIIIQLLVLILVPLLMGKLLRISDHVIDFSKKRKNSLKIASSVLLSLIIWLNISASHDDLSQTNFLALLPLFIPAFVIHAFTLFLNHLSFLALCTLKPGEQRTMLIMTSAKSLSVSLTVLQLLDEDDIGSKGLVAIPMIICNFVQVIMDSFLAARWANIKIPDEKDKESVDSASSSLA